MNNDNLYWLFSASAQSIAAFIAFLLAGYALVYTMMEVAREKDETLEEIHTVLRKKYHSQLTYLAIIAGLAIAMSLLMVFLNRWSFPGKVLLMVMTTFANIMAIVGGLAFVVSIVNPSRYEKTAILFLRKNKAQLGLSDKSTSSLTFFVEFRNLEVLIRDYLRKHGLYIPSKGAPRMSFSFRQMVDVLLQNEVITQELHQELMNINKYRNLVFHGHIDKADEAMIEKTKVAISKMGQLPSELPKMREIIELGIYQTEGGSEYDCLWLPGERIAQAIGPLPEAGQVGSRGVAFRVRAKSVDDARKKLAAKIGPGNFV